VTPVNAGAARPASATNVTMLLHAGSSTTSHIWPAIAARKLNGRNQTTRMAMPKQRPVSAHERQPIAADASHGGRARAAVADRSDARGRTQARNRVPSWKQSGLESVMSFSDEGHRVEGLSVTAPIP
jgi:hypothetical protein